MSNSKKHQAEIGIIGGSGFYNFLEQAEEIIVDTPYGKPSDKIAVGSYQGQRVAFLPRHGKNHKFVAHRIPYRANIYALKTLGVKRIIAPCAAGSLQFHIRPGSFVICDEFVDRTHNRQDTYYNGPKAIHISSVQPYCPQLRSLAISQCKKLKIPVAEKGTVVVIEGPRFSSGAESQWFSKQGWEVVNMTQYPEVVLARELEMCYLNISLITDFDAGLKGSEDIKPVTAKEVMRVFNDNLAKVKELIFSLIPEIVENRTCHCGEILKEAQL
ncbi:MAG: S-methyl-5'-thioadenosine phosphorylase [Candidatus Kerfeldbacteria bacterium CG_4_10_14_0_8_um_filter_42_10]|uniref:S-methyl-5'-thioadenosine phosphorylase n=1 Tax=Candidatus Kerfeldbacteria bacterium CG_4_10_14_0_8_um_filter_42_10 TaxID=2014248 RepID=A0A2M7RIT4_9BACT|nr:MAG: S-methyl-5'-thioadenosine phosphorylase [Candidatus Kerfeldbacteria bacterium CG_4_10_14_0_8_um_filter_42_10]